MGTTLGQLRRDVGRLSGDLLVLKATAASDGTTVTDAVRVALEPAGLKGRQILCVAAAQSANVGWLARIASSDKAARTVTPDPPFPAAVAVGDEFETYNSHTQGFTVEEIDDCIGMAIDDVKSVAVQPVRVQLTTPYSSTTGHLTAPAGIDLLAGVEWLDDESLWQEVPGAGWTATEFSPDVRLDPWHSGWLDTRTLRLVGYAEPDRLEDDDEETTIDPEFLRYQALHHLMMAATLRQNDTEGFARRAERWQQKADQVRPKAATRIEHGPVIRIRR